MASESGSTYFYRLFNESSKELYSEKFYDAMEKETADLENYEQKCKDIWVNTEKEQIIQVCKKYLRFLDTSTTWRRQFTEFDVSLLLSYWLYEKLIKIYGDRNSEEINRVFGGLQSIWANFFKYTGLNEKHIINCKPELTLVHHEDWKNRKKLYDYYVDYEFLFSMAQNFRDKCDYYKKIKEMSPVYESYEGKCPTIGHDCPKFFHKFHKKNHEHILQNLPCHTQIEQPMAAAAQGEVSSSHHTGHERGLGASKDGPGQPGSEFSTLNTETTQETDIRTKVANSVLGAAPVLLTATALYRYTPLGPWIRRFGGGRTNNMNPMDTFSPYTQETGDMFSENTENYISYQPI